MHNTNSKSIYIPFGQINFNRNIFLEKNEYIPDAMIKFDLLLQQMLADNFAQSDLKLNFTSNNVVSTAKYNCHINVISLYDNISSVPSADKVVSP